MTDQELVSVLYTASESPDVKDNIPLRMLLTMAAERIAEQSSTWKDMKENIQ
jgi:hypothetical protein